MSSHYLAMSAYSGFPSFMNNQPPSAPSTSENSSGCSSPPCFRPGDTNQAAPLPENAQQPNGLADDDDLGDDDPLEGCFQSNPSDSKLRSNYHPYARNDHKHPAGQGSKLKATTAERRATHNAIERARRESLNGRFLQLARALPTMQNVKRPSKSVIVNKSLEWICQSQVREYDLLRENTFLRNQLNELRVQLQMEPLPPNRSVMVQGQPIPYAAALAGVHPTPLTGLDSNRNFGPSSGPYMLPNQQPAMTQRSSNIDSKHQAAVSGSNPAQAHSSPTTHQPASAPLSVSQAPANYLSPKSVYEPNEGADKTAEEAQAPQTFGTTQASDEKASSIYFPGLSIHAESGSPFQSLSEPEGPLSTAGSSPNRLRYFSSSGSSDGSDKSPSGADYPSLAGPFGGAHQPLTRPPLDQLNPGGSNSAQMEIGSGVSNRIGSNQVAPLSIESFEPAHCSSTEPANPLMGFIPAAYSDHNSNQQDIFASELTNLPRNTLPNSFPNLSSFPNHIDLSSSNGFAIGAPWVWG